MSESGQKMKSFPRHKLTVAVIGLTLFIILAAGVSAVVIVIVLGRQHSSASPQYFSGSFTIRNLDYASDYKDRDSAGFKALSDQIISLLSSTFQNSTLKSQYNMSQVTRIRAGSVIPEFVVLFNDYNSENKNSSSSAQGIFTENLIGSKTDFEIDPTSLQLTEISASDALNLLSDTNVPDVYTVRTTIQESPQNYTACGIGGPSSSNKIVGGSDAPLGAWPWQASLLLNGKHKCGASLVSDTWLASAAHCFDSNKDASSWTVVLGTIHLTTGPGRKLQDIIIYENYTRTTHANDIALLKLSTAVDFTQYIRPVCLPDASDVFADGASCYVTGWGSTEEDGRLASILQQAEVKIINAEQCASPAMYGVYNIEIGPSMICAGYEEGKIDSCQGDSGGPLVATQSSGHWYLVGLVSFGYGCAQAKKPGVYCRVTNLRSWINEKTGL